MAPLLTPSLIAMDFLCCMGLGFLSAGFRVAVPAQSAISRFIVDFCMVLLALILVQSYAAQSSNAGALRFYMLLALCLGAFAFAKVLAPYQLFITGVVHCIIGFPMRIVSHKLIHPAFYTIKRWYTAQKGKIRQKKMEKSVRKQLQNTTILMYNSNVESFLFTE